MRAERGAESVLGDHGHFRTVTRRLDEVEPLRDPVAGDRIRPVRLLGAVELGRLQGDG